MSNTPETDAAQHEGLLRTNPIPLQVVTAEFARKLERERDEALEKYDNFATEHMLVVNKLAKERDEARADAARIADILSGLELRSTDELARLEQKRNEARAERDILRLDAQREAEHHDRMVDELQRLYAKLEEARAIADELAAIAAHCLGSHSFALSDTTIKIAAALKRWKKSK
jgi:hypothetical protein